ncbi:hypothetical protein OE903_23480 [Bacillus sp. B6(2022)]|nr:hypothetical protein [Bacillus sp. B6(2022)]
MLQRKIRDISNEMKYLVDQEKEEAQSNISSMKDEIKNISDKEFLLESDKKILIEKTEKLELKKPILTNKRAVIEKWCGF